MATILGYGFVKPDVGDESSTQWMVDHRNNWQKVNDHTHNGVDSALISIPSTVKVVQSYAAAGWALVADGVYAQTVTMPVGYEYENAFFEHMITNGTYTDCEWNPRTFKTGLASYLIYSNDNTITFDVRYF